MATNEHVRPLTEHTQAPDYERLVREAWEQVRCGDAAIGVLAGPYWFGLDTASGICRVTCFAHSRIGAAAEAWEYTENLKREIAEIDEEIAVCHEYIDGRERFVAAGYKGYDNAQRDLNVFKRILASRQAIREEKARGLR